MKQNFDKKTGLHRFIKINGLEDVAKFSEKDMSAPVFLDKQIVSKLKHITENLYELDGDYYIPSNY